MITATSGIKGNIFRNAKLRMEWTVSICGLFQALDSILDPLTIGIIETLWVDKVADQ